MTDVPGEALGRLRALAVADDALARRLHARADVRDFAALAVSEAAARGIAVAAERLAAAAAPDPLGIAAFAATPASGTAWPGADWLPVQVVDLGGQVFVDWLYFGARPLREPFFEDSVRRALRAPFNRAFRYRLALADFVAGAAAAQSLKPSGLIFHMSRCGSTLAAQMLAARADTIVVSEAAPIDAMVQAGRTWPQLPAARHAALLAAMIAAYGRPRRGGERHYVLKLDSWHALALPLFRQAVPSVPWVFMYRAPLEVLVSQMRQRGTQMVPQIVHPSLYGIDAADVIPDQDYCARVLRVICAAAADHYGAGGLLMNYRDLPASIMSALLPHFGIACDDDTRALMLRAAGQNAKSPSLQFEDDSAAKQAEATPALRAAAERHLATVYARLEALRAGP